MKLRLFIDMRYGFALGLLYASQVSALTSPDQISVIAAYQKNDKVKLSQYLDAYRGTPIYPYFLLRMLPDNDVKNGTVSANAQNLLMHYPHNLGVKKLLIGYLKVWAAKSQWSLYQRNLRTENILVESDDAEFVCGAVSYLMYRNQPVAKYAREVVDNIDRTTPSCNNMLTSFETRQVVASDVLNKKVLELAVRSKAEDRTMLVQMLNKWPQSQQKSALLQAIRLIGIAKKTPISLNGLEQSRGALGGLYPLVALHVAAADMQSLDSGSATILHQVHGFGLSASPYVMDLVARAAILDHDWAGLDRTINAMSPVQHGKPIWQYWQAIALKNLGKTDIANEQFQGLVSSNEYYGWLAREQMGIPLQQDNAAQVVDQQIRSLKVNPKLTEIQSLNQTGLWVEAAQEFNQLTRNFKPEQYAQAAKIAQSLGVMERQINYAERSKTLSYTLRFPVPFEQQIKSASSNVHIELINAIIRQESRFIPYAYSAVGAVGLMQLMPGTARQIAPAAGVLVSLDTVHLMEPSTNIRLGATYLAYLGRNFGFNNAHTIAAYNAGPNRIQSWNKKIGHLRTTEWIELIPFDETRSYVKSVTSNQAFYQVLNGHEAGTFSELLGQPIMD